MKNKLISTENITFLVVIIIGILIAALVYKNDLVINSKITPDNVVVSNEVQSAKTEELKDNAEVTTSTETENAETNEPSDNVNIEANKIPSDNHYLQL